MGFIVFLFMCTVYITYFKCLQTIFFILFVWGLKSCSVNVQEITLFNGKFNYRLYLSHSKIPVAVGCQKLYHFVWVQGVYFNGIFGTPCAF